MHQRKRAAIVLSCSNFAQPPPFLPVRKHPQSISPADTCLPPGHPSFSPSSLRIHNHTHLLIHDGFAHHVVFQNHLRRSLIKGFSALSAFTHFRRFASRAIYFSLFPQRLFFSTSSSGRYLPCHHHCNLESHNIFTGRHSTCVIALWLSHAEAKWAFRASYNMR